tara:strand:- start:76 stop:672 length:597 start_codon:yes stop_codon:yes gene_type:complete
MIRYILSLTIILIFSSPALAQKITQQKFEEMRGECLAVKESGNFVSTDHEVATNKCLSSCPENLGIFNNRALTLCMSAHASFKRMMGMQHSAPIPRVAATIDYQGHGVYTVISTDNAKVSENCSIVSLSEAKSYPPPMRGYQMMASDSQEEPITGSEVKAVLINVRLFSDEKQNKGCSAEVIHLRCRQYEADQPICNP